jgi:predicted anti-sigma-YlaC factor YlaD
MMRPTERSERGCERARAWISLGLDGELSELEGALLQAHLARCDACTAAAAEVRVLADTLRSAPLGRPAIRFELPHRAPARAGAVGARLALAATLVALAAGLGVLAGSVDGGGGGSQTPADSDIALLSPPSPDDARDRHGGLRPGGRPVDPIEPRNRGI